MPRSAEQTPSSLRVHASLFFIVNLLSRGYYSATHLNTVNHRPLAAKTPDKPADMSTNKTGKEEESQEGLSFDNDGNLWETEHGPRGGDELNLIKKGANYGWPVVTHGIDYPGNPTGDNEVARPGIEQPVYYWSPSTAPGGLTFYKGPSKAWAGSAFVGMLNGRQLDRIKLAGGKVVEEEVMLTDMKARIRDVRLGSDGALYVMTDSGGTAITEITPATGQVLKLVPEK